MADYEKLRQKKLEENKRKIDELKLNQLSVSLTRSVLKPSPNKQFKRRLVNQRPKLVSLRRSNRLANLTEPVTYKEDPLYYFLENPRRRMRSGTSTRKDLLKRVYASNESRALTENMAIKFMEEKESIFPSFVKPMTQSHVTGGFWLSLPKSFSSTYLPKSNEYLTLIDEDGNEFQSLYLAPKNGLSGGWRGFSMEHDLVDGDALIFELINPKTFKIYIIRVRDYSK
ncbi:B3 domain-containing protein [Zostera marina]|uniref:B3 domain-containing protein n=1 Tax=Zostera marina TaxID=29655 RepID=A0A0K9PD48_ZOSMR|nr:B3 domain-containing protein [Zostera marina]